MIKLSHRAATPTSAARSRQQAGVRTVVLLLLAFVLGLGAGGVWIYRSLKLATEVAGNDVAGISESTLAVLKGLDGPLTIRYYALLDPSTVSAALHDYAARVNTLLNEYQREGNGRVSVKRLDARTDAASSAAIADGIKPFNADRGEACYLGILLSYKGKTEVMPLLAPEWEQALESDLTRAIGRLITAKPTASRTAAEAPAPNDAAIAEVKSIIPDIGNLSEEECKRILQEKSLTALTKAIQEMEARVKDEQQRLIDAQKGGSDAAIQSARASLQNAQSQQAEKIKQVAAKLQEQLAALKLVKGK